MHILKGSGATFLARHVSMDGAKAVETVKKAILNRGFSLVHMPYPCPTNFASRETGIQKPGQLSTGGSNRMPHPWERKKADTIWATGVWARCEQFEDRVFPTGLGDRRQDQEDRQDMKDRIEIVASGFGGQGVVRLGQIVGEAAVKQGLSCDHAQEPRPEMRGGYVRSQVVLSKDLIDSPMCESPDYFVALSGAAYKRFKDTVPDYGHDRL